MNKLRLLAGLAAVGALVVIVVVPLVVTEQHANDTAAADRKAMADAAATAAAAQGAHQVKYISAEPVDWNYVPSGENLCQGGPFQGDPALWTTSGVGSKYKKAQFFEYTDSSYTTRVPRPTGMEHLGLLGPLIRTTPGERITLYFKNQLSFNAGLQPSGLLPLPLLRRANGTSNAAAINWDAKRAAKFAAGAFPGGQVVYEWVVPPEAAPAADEPDAKLWLYRSALYPDGSDNAGLLGPILVSRAGADAPPPGRDVITVMQVMDENSSPFLKDNLGGRDPVALKLGNDSEVHESLEKRVVNGHLFCNTPGMEMVQGEKVRWHLATVGSEGDMHSAHWHGNTVTLRGHRADQVKLVPGTAVSVDLDARANGTWLLHCHVNAHLSAGMMALYKVLPATPEQQQATAASATSGALNGTQRQHFIAAEEVIWDYAPLGGNACPPDNRTAALLGSSAAVAVTPFDAAAQVFASNATGSIGSRYLKAVFVEYTDATFTAKVPRPPQDSYLGLLGPTLRAEVGDTLQVTFLNRLRYPASMHPHGVQYNKSSEGAPYNDGTSGADKADDAVPPGGSHTFVWEVPESAGPGPADPPTQMWMYHSHTNENTDTQAGLVGAIVLGRPGAFKRLPDGSLGEAVDVDREAVLFFSIMDEQSSLFWADNEALLAQRDAAAPQAPAAGAPQEEADAAAAAADAAGSPNQMHAINGYIYCNGAPLALIRGQTVRFHVMALGTEVDLHSASLTDASWEANGQRSSALSMMPGGMQTADVAVTAAAGLEVVECRVAAHVQAGMRALVSVQDAGATTFIGGASQDFVAAAAAAAALQPAAEGPAAHAIRSAFTAAAAGPTVRRHYIAAIQIQWDYAPLGLNNCSVAGPQPFSDKEGVYLNSSATAIGRVFTKAAYRGYTSSSFSTPLAVPQYHGLLGPVVAAEVGDVLEVTFLNNLTFPANLCFDGGLMAVAGSADPGEAVAPGDAVTYRLFVPQSAGPGPSDLSTVAYPYISSVDQVGHSLAGLFGILMVARNGTFGPTSTSAGVPVPADVDAILPLFVGILDEGGSPYLEQNLAAVGLAALNTSDPDFVESNLKHALNGFLVCNGPDVVVPANSTLRVITVTMGTEADLHSIQFMGQVLEGSPAGSSRAAIEPIMSAVALTADLRPQEVGRWTYACAIHDHIEAGMQAALTVA